jgi:caffeoyl-CoA O-methyltransferase
MDNEIHEILEHYVETHTDDVSPLLQALLAETQEITGLSRWSIGKVEGKLVQLLIKLSGTRKAVEVGTFTGYSALVIAEALPDDGMLTTCENNAMYADIARRYFKKSPHGKKIELKFGPALASLKEIPDGNAGFFFIDADKPSYGVYFDEALRILQAGGFIIVDNVFWRYKIFKKKITNQNAKAIAEFNEMVMREQRVEKVMLSVRDGIYLIRKN